MSFQPKNFNATMELQAAITDVEKIEMLSDKKELYSEPVPDLGFEIKHLCEVGVILKYQIGYSTKFLGSTTIVFGATSSLPDDAVFTIDLLDRDKFSHSGFEGHALHPIFDVKAATNALKFAVYTQADIVFGIKLNKIGKLDLELNLKIPQLSATVQAGYSKHLHSPVLKSELLTNLFVLIEEGGFCSHDDGAREYGARVTDAISLELWFEVYFGEEDRDNVYSYRIFNVTDTLDDGCWALDIKKLAGTPGEMAMDILLPLSSIPSLGP